MKFFLNGKFLGDCKRYFQDRARKTWVFEMGEGVAYNIGFDEIKLFHSAGELRVELENRRVEA